MRWELEALVHAVEPTVLISQRLSHQPPYGGTNVKLTQGQQGLLTIVEEQERAEILLSVSCTVKARQHQASCGPGNEQTSLARDQKEVEPVGQGARLSQKGFWWQPCSGKGLLPITLLQKLSNLLEIQKFSISLPASVRRHHLSPCCV